jgi:hypothetical protein
MIQWEESVALESECGVLVTIQQEGPRVAKPVHNQSELPVLLASKMANTHLDLFCSP